VKKKMSKMQLIIAGHGGQGVLELANNISYYELLKGHHIAYTPSYGPESRGGKVKCYVVSSEDEIDSPIVEEPDFLIVMNIPSMDFVPLLRKNGILLMNSSLITEPPTRKDIRVLSVPATEIADGLKEFGLAPIQDTRIAANSIMFGGYLALTEKKIDKQLVEAVFSHFLTDRKAVFVPLNTAAVERGFEFTAHLLRPALRDLEQEREDKIIEDLIESSYV
jgi:2-oxoglutarate ferredoxin oxidoreductase subunit gamma